MPEFNEEFEEMLRFLEESSEESKENSQSPEIIKKFSVRFVRYCKEILENGEFINDYDYKEVKQ